MPYWTAIFLAVAAIALPFAVGSLATPTVAEPARLVFAVFASLGLLTVMPPALRRLRG